jgi:hypothetical protein
VTFDPVGLLGRADWNALCPLHRLAFGGMLRSIARAAARERTDLDDSAMSNNGMQPTRKDTCG